MGYKNNKNRRLNMGPQSRYNVEKMLEKAHKEKVMTRSDYQKFKVILLANVEDRELGLEALKNSNPSEIQLMLIGKYLHNHKRHDFIKMFPHIEDKLVPWEELFPIICKLKPNKETKELVEHEFNNSLINMIKEHHKFIDDIKIQLKW